MHSDTTDTPIPAATRPSMANLVSASWAIDLVEQLLAPDYVNHSPGSPELPPSRDGVRIVVQALRTAFPDLRYEIEQMVEAEDTVAVRATLTGSHRGELFGMPATGKHVRVSQMTFERFRGSQIVAHHRLTDDLVMLRQLGAQ